MGSLHNRAPGRCVLWRRLAFVIAVATLAACSPPGSDPSPTTHSETQAAPSVAESPASSSPPTSSPPSTSPSSTQPSSSPATTIAAPSVNFGQNPPKDLSSLKPLRQASLPTSFPGHTEDALPSRGALFDNVVYRRDDYVVTVSLRKQSISYRSQADGIEDTTYQGRALCGRRTSNKMLVCIMAGSDGSALSYVPDHDLPLEQISGPLEELYDLLTSG